MELIQQAQTNLEPYSRIRWLPEKSEAGVRSHVTFVMLMVAVATAYRLWAKAHSGATHQVTDHQISNTVHQVLATDTGELTESPVAADLVPTHLASAIMPQPIDETGDEKTADKKSDFLAHSLLNGQGTRQWRRQLQRENRDKVIVFIGNQYGIFDTHEFLILSGVPLRALPPHLGSREDVLRRFDCDVSAATKVRAPDTWTICYTVILVGVLFDEQVDESSRRHKQYGMQHALVHG